MSKIKDCPFCGTPDGAHGPSVFTEQGKSFVGCIQCGARGPAVSATDYTRDEYVIGRWNSRLDVFERAALSQIEERSDEISPHGGDDHDT